MADFSSWGATPELTLKPEITAPGAGIYAAVPGGYESMDGTSMASPHAAGGMAIVQQALKARDASMSGADRKHMTDTTEAYVNGSGQEFSTISGSSRLLPHTFTTNCENNRVAVAPGKTADVTVTVTGEGRKMLAQFPNDSYVEGFVTLTQVAADGSALTDPIDLGLPFLDAATVVAFHHDGTLSMNRTSELVQEYGQQGGFVMPGFYGATREGQIKLLDRGGGDISGSILAKCLGADLYENWTDVSGFYSADPRIVPEAQPIARVTYEELRELSYMGASVLHEDAVFPVRRANIPINIRNTNRPEDKGTLIVESTCRKPRHTITGIAGKKGFCSINIEKAMMNSEVGFGRRVLSVFEQYGINFEHMPSGIDTMTIYVHQSEFEDYEQSVIAGIHRAVEPDTLEMESDLALLAVVGRGMRSARGTAGRIFSALAHARVNVKMIDQGSSEWNIIIGVKNDDFETAIKAIYDIFVTAEL
mgnify:CR=1 FL=1